MATPDVSGPVALTALAARRLRRRKQSGRSFAATGADPNVTASLEVILPSAAFGSDPGAVGADVRGLADVLVTRRDDGNLVITALATSAEWTLDLHPVPGASAPAPGGGRPAESGRSNLPNTGSAPPWVWPVISAMLVVLGTLAMGDWLRMSGRARRGYPG